MKVLNEIGHVNLFTPVISSGTENTGHHIEVPDNRVVLRDLILEKQSGLIIEAIKGKSGKKYGPDDHLLVVVFDDYTGFRSEREFKLLRSSIDKAVDLAALDFKKLYLLGSSGNTLRELPLPKKPRHA